MNAIDLRCNMQETQETFLPGTTVHVSTRDRYVIESLLGRGGFSAIYLVRDQRVKQNLYALKEVINPDKREREGFTFECQVLMHLEHPALPRVYRVFEDSKHNRAYVLMDYVEGPNLKSLQLEQPEKRFSLTQVVDIMAPIVDAVSFLHHQNPPIVHRDIKPANIIVPITGAESVLVDFGIAKTYESEATTTAVRYCSPGYGAPEQYSIGTTPRTDIYGLGATIYTLLTGTVPTDALQRMIELNERKPDPLVPINQLAPTVPVNAARVIHRALSTRSTSRFADVEEFWQAFTAGIERQRPVESAPLPRKSPPLVEGVQKFSATITLPGKAQAFLLKKPGLIVGLLLIILLLVGLGVETVLIPALKHQQPALSQKPMATLQATPRSSPNPTSSAALYPPIAAEYNGMISDNITSTTTKMSLSAIQQSGEHLRGNFTGLGLTGIFVGTVDLADHIHFQVKIYAGSETIALEGTIKLGGILAGSYQILNQNQQFTGESGLWSVSPPA
jgi:serine/threonine protein kinase